MFIVAQIFGILIIITNVLSMQMKKKKQIILMFILANLFSAINFILLESYSGAIICFFAIIQTYINEIFENKNQQVPKIIIGIYIIISITLGAITFRNIIDILPIICSILYTITIIQSKEKNIRKITLINMVIWLVYDIVYHAYTAAISDIMMTISALIGIYKFDYKKEKEKMNKKTIMIDMDEVIVIGNFSNYLIEFLGEVDFSKLHSNFRQDLIKGKEEEFRKIYKYKNLYKDGEEYIKPQPNCVEVIKELNEKYDIYISTAYIWKGDVIDSATNLKNKFEYLQQIKPK